MLLLVAYSQKHFHSHFWVWTLNIFLELVVSLMQSTFAGMCTKLVILISVCKSNLLSVAKNISGKFCRTWSRDSCGSCCRRRHLRSPSTGGMWWRIWTAQSCPGWANNHFANGLVSTSLANMRAPTASLKPLFLHGRNLQIHPPYPKINNARKNPCSLAREIQEAMQQAKVKCVPLKGFQCQLSRYLQRIVCFTINEI